MATRFLIAFLLIASGLQAQVFQTNNTPYKFRGIKADSMLITAKGCDTAYLSNPKWGTSTAGALYVDTCNKRFYFHDGIRWNQVSGGTAAGCDSCYYAVAPLTDSSGFEIITLDGRRDTVQFTGGAAVINSQKVDSVTTVGDSLKYWINGTSTHIGSLAASIVNGDTTIFDFIVDTTNVARFQIPYADTTGYFKGDSALTWQPSDKTLVTDNLYLYGTTTGKAANLWLKIPSPLGGFRPRIYAGRLPTDVSNGAIYFSGGGSNAIMEINSGDNNQLLLRSPDGDMLFRQTDGLYRFYDVAQQISYNRMLVINDSGYIGWRTITDTTGLGDLYIRNQFATKESKVFNIRSGRMDSLYASGSSGLHFATNSGISAFEYGGGGGTQVIFNGFAGYNANRAASYTARSFTDVNFVDSSIAAVPTVVSYGKNSSGDSTILLLSNGQRFAAKDSVGGGGGITGIGTFGTTGTAKGLSVSGTDLIMHPATTTTPGGVSTGSQAFAGEKSFTGLVNFGNLLGSAEDKIRFTNFGAAQKAGIGIANNFDLQVYQNMGPGHGITFSAGGDLQPGTTNARFRITNTEIRAYVPFVTSSSFESVGEIVIDRYTSNSKLKFYDFGTNAQGGITAYGFGQMYYIQTSSDNGRNFYWMKGGTPTYSSANELMRLHSFTSQLGINVQANVDPSAQLQVNSTNRGFLPPRMTTTQRTAISSPAEGLIVFDTDTKKLYCYDGTTWQACW